jgi:hypothetical protein
MANSLKPELQVTGIRNLSKFLLDSLNDGPPAIRNQVKLCTKSSRKFLSCSVLSVLSVVQNPGSTGSGVVTDSAVVLGVWGHVTVNRSRR